MNRSVWIGFDPRESAAFAIACRTARRYLHSSTPVKGLVLADLKAQSLYARPTELRPSLVDGPILWDVISEAPMSTEHACARFFVPYLCARDLGGWAMFCDGDVMFRKALDLVFDKLDSRFALYCVKRLPQVSASSMKMDGREQTTYARKNWSSVMIFNCDHPANDLVTKDLDMVNFVPGRDLHRFCWLPDELIGDLDSSLNHLVGVDPPRGDAAIVHMTLGTPDMRGYENSEYADEWRQEHYSWAQAGGV